MTNLYNAICVVGLLSLWLFNSCDSEEPARPEIVTGAVINPQVGGPTQPNQVFIDLSTQSQYAAPRTNWDFAFYNGAEFTVLLNSSVSALARPLEKTDLFEVTSDDTAGWGSKLDIDAIFSALFAPAPPSWISESRHWMDDLSRDPGATAIAISHIGVENKAYIVNRGKNPDGSPRGWLKIRVTTSDNSYSFQYAEIGSPVVSEVIISKTSSHNFNYLNVDAALTTIEPEKTGWDMAFTTYTNLLAIDEDTSIPYAYKDFVIHNRHNVKAAEVLIGNSITYESFTKNNLASVTLSENITTIGSSWRTTAQPGSGQANDVKRDRFYIISDTDENIYKLRFTQLVDPITGERGYPQIEYQLL